MYKLILRLHLSKDEDGAESIFLSLFFTIISLINNRELDNKNKRIRNYGNYNESQMGILALQVILFCEYFEI